MWNYNLCPTSSSTSNAVVGIVHLCGALILTNFNINV